MSNSKNYYNKYLHYKKKYKDSKRINVHELITDMKKQTGLYQHMLGPNIDVKQLLLEPEDKFMDKLCENIKSKANVKKYGTFDTTTKIQARIKDLTYLLGDKIKPDFKYMDIGCNDGTLTNGIANHFKFDRDNVYGADIQFWSGKENDCKVNHMYFVDEDKPVLKFPDNYFDLITCFEVLHHNKNVYAMIKELRRVLKKGGNLVIREHDMYKQTTKEVLDMVHIKYLCIEEEDTRFPNYIGDYKSAKTWDKLFDLSLMKTIKPHGVSRMYTSAYTKN